MHALVSSSTLPAATQLTASTAYTDHGHIYGQYGKWMLEVPRPAGTRTACAILGVALDKQRLNGAFYAVSKDIVGGGQPFAAPVHTFPLPHRAVFIGVRVHSGRFTRHAWAILHTQGV